MKKKQLSLNQKQTNCYETFISSAEHKNMAAAEYLSFRNEKNNLIVNLGQNWELDEYTYDIIINNFPAFLEPALCTYSDGLRLHLDKTGLLPLSSYLKESKTSGHPDLTEQLIQIIIELLDLIEQSHQHLMPLTHFSLSLDLIFLDTQALKSGIRLCFWPVLPAGQFANTKRSSIAEDHQQAAHTLDTISLSSPVQSTNPSPVLPEDWQKAANNLADLIINLLVQNHPAFFDQKGYFLEELTKAIQTLRFSDAVLLLQNDLLAETKPRQAANKKNLLEKTPGSRRQVTKKRLVIQRLFNVFMLYGHWFLVFFFIILLLFSSLHAGHWMLALLLPALFFLLTHLMILFRLRPARSKKPGHHQLSSEKQFQFSFLLHQLTQQWRALFSPRETDDQSAKPYFQTDLHIDQPDLFIMAELRELSSKNSFSNKDASTNKNYVSDKEFFSGDRKAPHTIGKKNMKGSDRFSANSDHSQTATKTAYILTDQFIIGRDPYRTDLYLPYSSIGRQHARIDRKAGSFFITDLGSLNGTTVDGKKITARESIWLPGQCEISFAQHRFLFRSSV